MSDFRTDLALLVSGGVELWVDGDRLGFRKARGKLTAAEKEFLQSHKAETVAFLGDRRLAWLSGVQQRIWFISRYAPQSNAYTIPFLFRIDTPVDVGRLHAALRSLVDRHVALRASFPELAGVPVQLFEPAVSVELPVVDLPDDPEARDDLVRHHLVQPFDLATGPLFKAFLFRSRDGGYQLGLSMHHLVSDGWSIRLMLDELAAIYADDAPPAPVPAAQLVTSFLHLERARDPAVAERDLGYWRKRLADPPNIALPCDFARPRQLAYQGAQVRSAFDPGTARRLHEFARSQGTTLFAVLLAAFGAVLHQLTRQRDILLGTPYANRPTMDTQRAIGCLMTTLVLRLDADPGATFEQLIADAGESRREALDHSALSFDRVVEALALERDTSRNPVFQVLFGHIPTLRVENPKLPLTHEYLDPHKCQFDLELYYVTGQREEDLACYFVYDTALFEHATIEAVERLWVQTTEWLLEHPRAPLAECPRLTPEQRARIRDDWNATSRQFEPSSVHGLVYQRASAAADKIAVECGEARLTYGELTRRSDLLAARLAAHGVGPGASVGLRMQRSVEMIVAALGILRAGAAFVPLDPRLPAERLAYMSRTSGIRVVICDSEMSLEIEPPGTEGSDARRTNTSGDLDATSFPPVAPGDRAYVMFTSGSTGNPKGVGVTHGNLVNLLHAMAAAPGISPDDRLLAVTSLGFDISLLEVFLPLTQGATVIVAPEGAPADARWLVSIMEQRDVTIMQGTPSTWQLLLNSGWTGRASLKALVGGEALSPELAQALLEKTGELWNVYGPTETTVWSTRRRIVPEDDGAPPRVDIGHPIENTRAYVVDEARRPVPIGVPGELLIAGDGVATGYVGRDDLTAERFVDLAFDELGPTLERCYATGDLVRYLPDGSLAFLGRLDHQVKLRGHRIELGEIESCLARIEGVAEAVVTVQGTGEHQKLVAAVRCRGPAIAEEALHAALARSLPSYMLPQIAVVDRFPTTANGKVDRKALAATFRGTAARKRPPEPLATATEALIARWFGETLGCNADDRNADFFELGGQSLLATRVVHCILTRFGVEVPLHVFFRAPTVRALAERVDEMLHTRRAQFMARIDSMTEAEIDLDLARLGLL